MYTIFLFVMLIINLTEVKSLYKRPNSNFVQKNNNEDNEVVKSDKFYLKEHPNCINEVRKFCFKNLDNNLQVLKCLHNDIPNDVTLDPLCQDVVWNLKLNMTKSLTFEAVGASACKEDSARIKECNDIARQKNMLVPCLVERIDEIQSLECQKFLTEMKSIIFTDYHLIYKFVSECEEDLNKSRCGRIESSPSNKLTNMHGQGLTLSCLMKRVSSLLPECRHEILRIAELQSNDYHNDRQLFMACREDREHLCGRTISGNGEVYKCLYKHKLDPEMSSQCQEKLRDRQKLEHEDYKVNYGLTSACRKDILEYRCYEDLNEKHSQQVQMAKVLICLDNAHRLEKEVSNQCLLEIKSIRRSLMEDMNINPEVMASCSREMDICSNFTKKTPEKMIHCLMKLARSHDNEYKSLIGNECLKSVTFLLKEVDIVEDVDVDLALQEACSTAISTKCKYASGQESVLRCLLNQSRLKNVLNQECNEHLIEIEYFLNRDFKFSGKYLAKCNDDMNTICNYNFKENNQVSQSTILSCLYRNRKNKIKPECKEELINVLLNRAHSVDIPEDVISTCMTDLARFCRDKKEKNKELECLEDNLEKLSPKCAELVSTLIEEEDENPEINSIFIQSCENFLNENCKDNDLDESKDGSLVMECLIKHKYDPSMPEKCRVGIMHHQLITMKEFKFSHNFNDACSNEILSHCSQFKEKTDVVYCLSEINYNDTLLDKKQRINNNCLKRLYFELLQSGENIDLDSKFKDVCAQDRRKFCKDVPPGHGNILNCLRVNRNKLQPKCRSLLFKREMKESINEKTDYKLMMGCKKMIKLYCKEEKDNSEELFKCLKTNMDEYDFDENCHDIVKDRMRIRAKDIRLNPYLRKNCSKDINEFCLDKMIFVNNSTIEVEGVVISCLRRVFAHRVKGKLLSKSCEKHIRDQIRESAVDFIQDAALVTHCKPLIEEHCLAEAHKIQFDSMQLIEVENCLAKKLLESDELRRENKNCFEEVIRVISENKIDIHVDPILEKLCSIDILGLCKGIAAGEGRHLSCLLSYLQNDKKQLHGPCRKGLEDRSNLWSAAAKLPPPENLYEVIDGITSSPSRLYLQAFFFGIFAVIFVGGLFCGRITKRVSRQAKQK